MDVLQAIKSITDIGFSLFVGIFLLIKVVPTVDSLKEAVTELKAEIKLLSEIVKTR